LPPEPQQTLQTNLRSSQQTKEKGKEGLGDLALRASQSDIQVVVV
jgi:hypothetical protein